MRSPHPASASKQAEAGHPAISRANPRLDSRGVVVVGVGEAGAVKVCFTCFEVLHEAREVFDVGEAGVVPVAGAVCTDADENSH